MDIARPARTVLRRIPLLRRGSRKLRYWQLRRKVKGPRIIARFAANYPEAFFMQIGANDGEQLDPLRAAVLSNNWRGVMVEPVPYVYQRLRENYGKLSYRIHLENVAIAQSSGSQEFWHLRQADAWEDVPRLYDALGSFYKDVVLKHVDMVPNLEQRLTSTQVPCMTFSELCERHNVEHIDLVQIDTEGYDYEIIKLIDFERYRPTLLIYEHHHFSKQTRIDCQRYLRECGYQLYQEGMDTWCVRMQASSSPQHKNFLRAWRRLVPPSGLE